MRIIAAGNLREFWTKHPETAPSLSRWLEMARAAEWTTAADVRGSFAKAKVLNADRVRFEVAGGNFRMIVAFDFGRRIAFIKFLGTLAEYDRIDALTVSIFEEAAMMDVRPIRTEADHDWALREIERLWGAPPGSPEGDRLDVLATLVDAYEREHIRIPVASDPIDVLRFAIEDMGQTQAELARILGSRSRASEILGRKRRLTVEMIDAISKAWHIPADLLARPYELAAPPKKRTVRRKARPTRERRKIAA